MNELKNSKYVARAIEIPQVGILPNWIVNLSVLSPMRWATRGTILAAEQSLEHGFAVNLGGGFHHAKPPLSAHRHSLLVLIGVHSWLPN